MLASTISVGTTVQAGVSVVVGAILSFFNIIPLDLQYLLIMMLLDIITGMYAALVGNSHNSENGYYKSGVFARGLIKKVLILLIISLAYGLDVILNTNCIRNMTVIFFIINEAISILENVHCVGVPIPQKLVTMLEVYHEGVGQSKKDDFDYKEFVPTIINPKSKLMRKEKPKEWEEPTNDSKKEKP